MQGMSIQRFSIEFETAGELGGQVLGIGCRSAITAEKKSAAMAQGFNHKAGGIRDTCSKFCQVGECFLMDFQILYKYRLHVFHNFCAYC